MMWRCPALAATVLLPHLADASAPGLRLRNGVEIPLLAAGTWQYNETQAETSVAAALKAGFTLIDTAWDYNNQEGVGRAIKASGVEREKLFVETKVPGCGLDGAVSVWRCYNDTKKVLEGNLEKLGLSYVDMVIIHFPPLGSMITRTCSLVCGEVRDQWRALEEFYMAGKAKAIGVSNYCPSCFACLDSTAKVYPMINQIGYHIGMGPDPKGFKSFADKKGFALQAYSPLGNKPWAHGADDDIIHGKLTTSLAKAHNKSTIQVALKWLVQHNIPTVTKSSNPVHLAQDLDLWSWNLTDDEMDEADKYKAFGLPSFGCNFEEDEARELIV